MGKTKVGEFDVTRAVDENVVGFEIAMNNRTFVEVFESKEGFCDVESSDAFIKTSHL